MFCLFFLLLPAFSSRFFFLRFFRCIQFFLLFLSKYVSIFVSSVLCVRVFVVVVFSTSRVLHIHAYQQYRDRIHLYKWYLYILNYNFFFFSSPFFSLFLSLSRFVKWTHFFIDVRLFQIVASISKWYTVVSLKSTATKRRKKKNKKTDERQNSNFSAGPRFVRLYYFPDIIIVVCRVQFLPRKKL